MGRSEGLGTIGIRCKVMIFRQGQVSFLQPGVQSSSVSLYRYLFPLFIVSACHVMRGRRLWFTDLFGVGVVKWKFTLLGNN